MNIERMKALELHALKTALSGIKEIPETEEDFEVDFYIASLLVSSICALLNTQDRAARIRALDLIHIEAQKIIREGMRAKVEVSDGGFSIHPEH